MPTAERMPNSDTSTDFRELYLSLLERIDAIVRGVCMRNCLFDDEADDFRSSVHLKIIDDDHAVLREFRERSSVETYLATVINNHLLDDRVKKWGKWRPSARAKQLGTLAIQLETLLYRDRYELEQAIKTLTINGAAESAEQLRELAGELPQRTTRRFESPDGLESIVVDAPPDGRIREKEKESKVRRAARLLDGALAALEAEDRLILKMHFEDGFTMARIATLLDLPQKSLYRRRDRILASMREHVEAGGLEWADMLEIVGWKGWEMELDFNIDGSGEDEPGRSLAHE